MLKGPISMPKTNKFCVQCSLSSQNRFVSMGCQNRNKRFQEKCRFCPLPHHVGFLGRGSKGSLHREESNAMCLIKIGWEFLEITRGSEAPTPQAEPLETAKNGVNTFLAGFRILYISNMLNFHSSSCILRRNFPSSTVV